MKFFWPTVGEAVWRLVCREHTDLLPVLHAWLGSTGNDPAQIERAGHAVTAMAVGTDGQTLELLHQLVAVPRPQAIEVAARCLSETAQQPATAAMAEHLLQQWSIASAAALRRAVVYACRSELPIEQALQLMHRVMGTLSNDADDVAVAAAVAEALVQRFAASNCADRKTVLDRMRSWAGAEDVTGQLVALTFPVMVGTDLTWFARSMLDSAATAATVVQLTGHALNESAAYGSMRDVLLAWLCGKAGAPGPPPALGVLLNGLVEARQPGFLRWLLAVDRGPEGMPGKERVAALLDEWRGKAPTASTD
ncbi:hypothetical protein ABZ924_11350 [Streptomyces sp. NPDC046876]|uniref:hypothetical protein n=1 Tax=Streptomyces sp. NPDC046876 TaxID=3155616 RepID=UPI0033EC2FB3